MENKNQIFIIIIYMVKYIRIGLKKRQKDDYNACDKPKLNLFTQNLNVTDIN